MVAHQLSLSKTKVWNGNLGGGTENYDGANLPLTLESTAKCFTAPAELTWTKNDVEYYQVKPQAIWTFESSSVLGSFDLRLIYPKQEEVAKC